MEGYIFSWTNFIKGWRPRYIILEKDSLFISHKKGDDKKKTIEIKPNTTIIDDKKTKFSLRNPDEKIIYLKAKTQEEKDEWIINLNNAINSTFGNKINPNKILNEKGKI